MKKNKGTEKLESWKNEQVFLIDSREKKPLLLKPSKVVTLPEGDYSLEGIQQSAIIERKSLNDLIGSLTYGRNRFFRELHRMEPYELKWVLVDDASWSDVFAGNYYSKASPDSMIGSIMSILTDFKIQVQFCKDRRTAAKVVRKALLYYKLKYAGTQPNTIIEGTRFGNLTALFKTSLKTTTNSYWFCVCDCGKETLVDTTALKKEWVQSCGCLHNSICSVKYSSPKEAAVVSKFNMCSSSAKRRGLVFTLDIEQFTSLVFEACAYCGSQPIEYYTYKRKDFDTPILFNGVDRVDNAVGYEIENCVSCCKFCNSMKYTYPKDFFIKHAKKVADFNKEPI